MTAIAKVSYLEERLGSISTQFGDFPSNLWFSQFMHNVVFTRCQMLLSLLGIEPALKYWYCRCAGNLVFQIYNQWQNILLKVRKSSKTGQDQKTLISAFAYVLTAVAKNKFLEK